MVDSEVGVCCENRLSFSSQVFELGVMEIVPTGVSHNLDVFLPMLCVHSERCFDWCMV